MALLAKIRVPLEDALTGGTHHDLVVDELIRRFSQGGTVEVYKEMDNDQPEFSDLVALVQSGGYFENLKLGLEFTSLAAAQQDVPSEVRGYQYPDPENEGEMLTHNFHSWLKQHGGQVLKETAGSRYICKANYEAELLNSDELKVIHALTGIKVIEWQSLKDAFAQVETGEWTVINL